MRPDNYRWKNLTGVNPFKFFWKTGNEREIFTTD